MHAVWRELLDAEFQHAYKYGMVVVRAEPSYLSGIELSRLD